MYTSFNIALSHVANLFSKKSIVYLCKFPFSILILVLGVNSVSAYDIIEVNASSSESKFKETTNMFSVAPKLLYCEHEQIQEFDFVFPLTSFGDIGLEKGIYIDEALSELKNIELINFYQVDTTVYHILSHGRPGELLIAGEWLDANEIVTRFSKILPSGTRHINIYGCNFAAGSKGLQALKSLELQLGVTIAASDDITGVDGDWDLEIGLARDPITLSNYSSNLQCGCNDYIYLNETSNGGVVHKFKVESNGDLTAIGSPWFSNTLEGDELELPHGVAIDLNGFIYIGETSNGDVRKLTCDGDVFPESDFVITGEGGFNFVSIDNTLFVNSNDGNTIDAYDLCTGDFINTACLDEGRNANDWGFHYDKQTGNFYSTGVAFGSPNDSEFVNDLWVYTIDDFGTGDCVPPLLSSDDGIVNVGDSELPYGNLRGVTTDLDGNIYIVYQDRYGNISGTERSGKVAKFSPTGEFIAESDWDTIDGDGGIFFAIGIVYSASNNSLYISTGSSVEDCVAHFDLDLNYLAAAVPSPGTESTAKGIGIISECCPDQAMQTIDQIFCEAAMGEVLYLNEIFPCNGTICGAPWVPDPNNVGVSFEDCSQSVTITEDNTCATFTKQGMNNECGAFDITYNLEVILIPEVVISGESPLCPSETLVLTSTTPNTEFTYQWQMSTTGCDGTWSDIEGATSDDYIVTGTSSETSYQLVSTLSGTCTSGECTSVSNCVTVTVDSDCEPICTLEINCTAQAQTSCSPANGNATATITGEQGNISYLWSSGETTASITEKAAGIYTVTVTDDILSSCTATCEVEISSTLVLPSAECSSTMNTNCETPNGTASVTTDATNPTYGWSTGATTASISDLMPGTYTVTVTDGITGCINMCDAVVGSTTEDPTLACSFTDNTSCTMPNGSVTATASNVSYLWSNGATTSMINNLESGTYTVTVTDLTTGCTATCTETIADPDGPTSCSVNVDSQPTCANSSGGAVTVSVVGGTMPYSYSWSNGATTATLTGLIGGNYTVTVTDANLCTTICSATLNTPMGCCSIVATCEVAANVSCFGGSDGSATASFSGDQGTVTYLWSDALGQTTATATGLTAGSYSVTITDDISPDCEDICMITISEPSEALVCSIEKSDADCALNTLGSIITNGSGGTAPYEYSLNGMSFQPGNTWTDLESGDYEVTIRDVNGCTSTCSETILQVNCIFDLALEKILSVATPGPFAPGDEVTFTIEVTNQGTVDAYNIELKDYYVPAELVLADNDWTILSSGVAQHNNDINFIGAGEMESVNITFTIAEDFQGESIVNYGEISQADDDNNPSNDFPTDEDSTPDDNQGDDELADDGEIVDSDNGNLQDDDADSDDYDPAPISVVQEFDLAIQKTYTSWDDTNMDGLISNGEDVTFTVVVYNQGTLDATGVEVTDYVPTGLTHPDGATVVTTIGDIANGASATYDITMTVEPTFMSGMITNNAEITAGSNELGLDDEDNPLDVIQGSADDESEVDTDNDTDDEAPGTPGVSDNPDDVDDYDPAQVMIGQVFDLAIDKVVNTTATPGPYVPGGEVMYTITVYNQGSLDATAITVEDYIPTGMSFVSSTDFSLVGAEYLATIPTLASGASTTLGIRLSIDNNFMGSDLTNNAEIIGATNALGLTDQDNDLAVEHGSSDDESELDTDNDIDDDYPGTPGTTDNPLDVDDYDPAQIEVEQTFDLALEKTLSTSGTITPGEPVTFNIEVTNQGTVDAYNVFVTDYYPSDLILADAEWTETATGVAVSDNEIPFIAVGESVSINITFTVNADFQGTQLINWAEISEADDNDDPTDGFPTDVDSTPDGDQFNSSGETDDLDDDGVINEDGTMGGDEDDHDPAPVTITQEFDLALQKTYTSWDDTNMDGLISVGEDVTFTVEIFNQGTVDATGVVVTDYVPTGLTHPMGTTVTTNVGDVAKGTSESYTIVLTVDPTFMGGIVTNNAEITAGSNALDLEDEDNPLGVVHGSIDDESEVDTDNDTDDEALGTPGVSDNPNDVDDYDPAQVMIGQVFDLAIDKLIDAVATPAPYFPNSLVTFEVTVYNQGTVDATDIIIEDYLPSGTSFESSPDFTLQGAEYLANITTLAAGSSTTLEITIRIDDDFMGSSLINNVEIVSAQNALGLVDQDDDLANEDGSADDGSELDTDNDVDDEAPGTPGATDNPDDIDDYDPAFVPVTQIFDLALEKIFNSSSETPIRPGTEVTFTLEVTNQGTLDAFNINLVDYIPAGLTLNDTDWTESSPGIAYLNNDIIYIARGEMESVNITFTVDEDFMGTEIINWAEINQADDNNDPTDGYPTDVDSTPNDDQFSEGGETDDLDDDGVIDEDGTNGGDEDDHDPALIEITQSFDLALEKVFTSWDDTDMNGMIDQGENVTFTVTVYNQGNLDATDVVVTDYVPTGMIFNAADNVDFTGGPLTPMATVGSLPMGGEEDLTIVLQVDPTFMGMMAINNAEITSADNALGQEDDDNPLSVIQGTQDDGSELDTDNDTDDEFPGTPGIEDNPDDVDDYDPAMIMIGQVFDLALFKVYDSYNDLSGDGVLSPGDEVTFLITVVNQGTLDAYNIQISDYIPEGLSLIDPQWNNMQNVTIGQLNAVHPFLAAGGQTTRTITFAIDELWRGESIVNWAEISAADDNDDPSDGFPEDEDSTPNSIQGDDNFGGDDVIDNSNNDEDDHDPAEINPVIELDLALAKKDQIDDPISSYGEVRTFDIEVTNQGTILATEFTVVDYIPCGFEFVSTPGSNPGWTYNSTTRIAEFIYDEDILYPNDIATLEIQLEAVYCDGDVLFNWTNYAEISDYDDDFNDFNQDIQDIDSDPDATNFDDPGGQPWTPTDDHIDGDGTGAIGSNDPATDEDDHDPERVEIFDLALIKTISDETPGPYNYYDLITFDIEVFNQGNIGAQNIEVTDYIPEGYGYDASLNQGWTGTYPNVSTTITNTIPVGGSEVVSITLQIIQTDGGEKDWINYAEITASENENGEDRTDWDVDSNSGSNNSTENGVEPDDAEDNDIDSRDKGGEEDDHDPAGIEVFDLAQNKETDDDGPFEYGDEVVFTINVFNQGSIEASNINITDYIPCGYTFDTFFTSNTENGWTYDSMTRIASNTLTDNLSPGETTSVEIILAVTQCIDNDVSSFTNLSEISGADSNDPDEPADDIDSDPDTDPTDDEGGTPDTDEDDHVGDDSEDGNEDGITDEDDHDPERVEVFDLALKKELVTPAPYKYGDLIEMKITVCNQGNVNAANIEVSDYLPAGYSFEFANNLGWVGTVSAPTYEIQEVLIEDTCTDFPIFLTIEMTDGGEKDWINYAEITEATDEDGNPVTDADSNPGSNNNEENAVEPGDDADDDMTSIDKGGEEDDHDPAGIEIYDLAQRKTTDAVAPFRYGDDITYTIEVFNQGSIESSNIEITDYIPCGFEYLSSNDSNGWSYDLTTGNATIVLTDALVPGESETVDLTLRLQQCLDMDDLTFTNFTEISDSESNDPDEDPDDIDSDEDDDPGNDGDPTDDEITGDPNDPNNPDEDDHDPEEIDVFDLALIKELVTEGPYAYGDLIEFDITVCNQGNMTAANIVVEDYLPVGYSFDFGDNPEWGGTVDDPTYEIEGTLAEDACVTFKLFATIEMTDGGEKDWINYAEIIEATDEAGNPVTDADSNPGSDGPVENGVEPGDDADDDLESTDIGGEEDDHDPAGIEIYDLAQIKTTDDVGPFSYGDFVTFEVTVINQGSIESANIEVTDYIPCGFIYEASNNNNGWNYDEVSGNASITIIGPLAPGSSMTRSITLQIQECYENEDISWTNITEISDSESTDPDEDPEDVDSDEDDDPENDGPPTDDETNGDPDNPDNPDEDDSDPEMIEIFDLAIRKFIEDKGPYGPGDVAEYIIDVFNQGNVDAYSVEVTDYLNEGYIFDVTSNPGWSSNALNPELLTYTIEEPIAPGDSVRLILNLEVIVPDGANIGSWYNEAEISGGDDDTDPTNEGPVDADSYPDQDPDNDNDLVDGPDDDPLFDEEDDNDNVIDEHIDDPFNEGDDDEDDNDAADILVVGGLGDTVWKDIDGDGIQDEDEPGVAGVDVTLTDCEGNVVQTATTDADGFYFFNNLIPGDYQVSFDISGLPEGCAFTQQDIGNDDTIDSDVDLNGLAPCTNIQGGEYDSTFDAGLLILVNIGDFVWHDLDGDGIQDAGEPGIEDVYVYLFDEDNNLIEMTMTDADGYYLFENIYPDTYFIAFGDPDGFEVTFPNTTADDMDSDITNFILSPYGSTTDLFTIEYGQEDDLTFDAGYYMCVPIGELVWYDLDEDDIHDSVENGINGLEVNLYRLENGGYVLYETQVTGHKPGTPSDDGYYKFCAPPGTYYVEVSMPPLGLVLAQANALNNLPLTNSNESIVDSDMTNEFGNSTTTSFTVLSGEVLCNIGTGFYPMATLGNRVWFDDNQNGLQDDGEDAVEGVKVEAITESTGEVTNESTTNAEGLYKLDYLRKESYYLRVTPPSGYGFTQPNTGDDAIDSDVDHTNGTNTTRTFSLKPGDEILNVDAGIAFGVLPLTWIDVRAERLGRINEVSWITADEIDASHFIIERAYNQNLIFAEVGRVEANNKLGENKYSLIDYESEESGIYYYRIKQVDIDGRNGYSKIVYVSVENDLNRMSVSPNPAVENARLSIDLATGAEADITIFDRTGKLVRSYKLDYANEGYSKKIEINDLPSGVYTIRLIQGELEMNNKLIIVK